VACIIVLISAASTLPGSAASSPPAAGPSKRAGLVIERAFLPPPSAKAAHDPFSGVLILSATRMTTNPARLHSAIALKRDPQLFPAAQLSFITVDGDLVPTSQGVQRTGTGGTGKSYWDIIVQPGKVWSEPGEHGWSHASFPFALVNSIENETHNGIATFRYRGKSVSGLRYQITAETAPFVIDTSFTAHGAVPARYKSLSGPVPRRVIRTYKQAKAAAVPIADWRALGKKLGRAAPVIDTQVKPDELVLDGVDYDGVFYLRSCKGAAGPLAWCGRRRFGVWSATKSLITATALLRVVEKYGPSVFSQKIVDYVPELKSSRAWRKVTFDNAINMATGVGNGDVKPSSEEFGNKTYMAWYLARSRHQKLLAMAHDSHPLPWGPGHKMRYRDQDMFVLGVALDRYLKVHEGPSASLWSMLNKEVFRPIGIYYAPMNMTIEPGGAGGQPLMAYGFYPTIGDMVKIARLYQAHGRFDGKQILYRPRTDKILDTGHAYGLPAGPSGDVRAIDYYDTFWRHHYRLAPGCRRYIAEMNGYGSVTVALMPGNVTGVRVAHTSSELVAGKGGVGLAPLASLGPACTKKSVH
jgi:hypothetical protein